MAVAYDIDLVDGLDLLAFVAYYEPYILTGQGFSAGSTAGAAIADAPPGVTDGRATGTSTASAGGTVPSDFAATAAGSTEVVGVSGAIHAGAGSASGHAPTNGRSSATSNMEDEGSGRKIRVPKQPRNTRIGATARTKWQA